MSQSVLVCVTQLQDERLSIIDRDNRLLASKLADIVCSKGLVDHRNQYHLRRYNTVLLSFLTHHVMSSLSVSQPLYHVFSCHVCRPATSRHVTSCLSHSVVLMGHTVYCISGCGSSWGPYKNTNTDGTQTIKTEFIQKLHNIRIIKILDNFNNACVEFIQRIKLE